MERKEIGHTCSRDICFTPLRHTLPKTNGSKERKEEKIEREGLHPCRPECQEHHQRYEHGDERIYNECGVSRRAGGGVEKLEANILVGLGRVETVGRIDFGYVFWFSKGDIGAIV